MTGPRDLLDRATTAVADVIFAALGWLLDHGLDLLGNNNV